MKVWILTKEINDYNQEGEYFIEVYAQKPTLDQLREVVHFSIENDYKHLLQGGGQRGCEYEWYCLNEVEVK